MKKNNIREVKNIVTAVFFWLLLVGGLLAALYLTTQRTNIFSKASLAPIPQNITVSNISDNSFTVSWITKQPSYGFISYGQTESLGSIVTDERDLAERKQRLTHYVVLKNLLPETTYYFKVGSGSETFTQDNGKFFNQKTALTPDSTPPIPDFVFGTVKKNDQEKATDAIIYLAVGKGTLLSTYTKKDGNWLITLNNSRTTDLNNYLTINPEDQIDLFVEGGDLGIASTKTTVKNSQDLEIITLDQTKSSDTTKSGVSKRIDISVLKENFGKTGVGFEGGDLNNDGVVNANDFAFFFRNQI